MLKFYLDENISLAIVNGLRQRQLDCLTTKEAGLLGATDLEQLEFAAQAGRIVVTHDADFLKFDPLIHPHKGIIYCRHQQNIGSIIRFIELCNMILSPGDMENHIEFI